MAVIRPDSYRGAVRRALLVSTVEGILAELVSACAGGGALVAWALHLHAPAALVAGMLALPALAQSAQLPAARLTARLGARRTAVAAAITSRQAYALLALLPFIPVGDGVRLAVLLFLAAFAAFVGAIAQHAWFAWVAVLFRAPLRARVLARRSGRVTLAGSAGAVIVGAILDRCGPGTLPVALGALAGIAWLSGLVSAELLTRQHAPRAARQPRSPVQVRSALAPRRVRRGLRYTAAWNGALGLTASLTVMVMLQVLHLPLLVVAGHGVVVALASALAAPGWGKLVDRAGVARVLVVSAVGAAMLPFLWLATSERVLWPIAVDAVLGGVLLGGQGVAASNLALAVAPRGRRAEVHASYSSVAGVAFALASVASGVLTAKLPVAVGVGGGIAVRKLVFAAGGAARLGAAALSARVFRREPA
jgi:MFS family permease